MSKKPLLIFLLIYFIATIAVVAESPEDILRKYPAEFRGDKDQLHSAAYQAWQFTPDLPMPFSEGADTYVIQEVFCEMFETTNNTWNNETLTQHFYTSAGKIDTIYTQNWWNGNWNDFNRSSYFYDPQNGRLIERIFESTVITGSWQNVSRSTREYDSQGRDSIVTNESWGNLGWELSNRQVYTYDNLNRFIEIQFESWDDFSNTWAVMSRNEYIYNGNTNQLSEIISRSWSGTQWDNLSRNVYTYTGAGNFDEIIIQIWFSNDWFNNTRFGYSYDTSDYLIQVDHQQWDNVSTWNDFIRTLYTNDTNGLEIMSLEEFWVSNTWIGNERCTNTWQMLVTGIENPSAAIIDNYDLHNYPNPFNPETTISFTLPAAEQVTLKVYNLLGQEVATLLEGVKESGSHQIKFQANDLPSGIYFYQLQTKTASLTRKMFLTR